MKPATFDLETARDILAGGRWQDSGPLGITCGALSIYDEAETTFWQGTPQMTRAECQRMVRELQGVVAAGYTLVTWNGCSFDFAVLAQESDMQAECAKLALHHVDLMLIVTFARGWYLALQKALIGAKLGGKLKSVTLSDGTVLNGMAGAKAPELWANGEHKAVLAYLKHDVEQLLVLTRVILDDKVIRWTSNNGNPMKFHVPELLTVLDCFNIPQPDVAWMTSPPTRKQFVEWMFAKGELPDNGEYQMTATDFRQIRERADLEYLPGGNTYWNYLASDS